VYCAKRRATLTNKRLRLPKLLGASFLDMMPQMTELERSKLQVELGSLKRDEERFRYLVTSNRTSPEFRKEAQARLQDVRNRIYQLTNELKEHTGK
jgi:hypothetical protein